MAGPGGLAHKGYAFVEFEDPAGVDRVRAIRARGPCELAVTFATPRACGVNLEVGQEAPASMSVTQQCPVAFNTEGTTWHITEGDPLVCNVAGVPGAHEATLGDVVPYLSELSGSMDQGMAVVTEDIINTLGDMQFQDINRQLLEQINDALSSLSQHFTQIYDLILKPETPVFLAPGSRRRGVVEAILDAGLVAHVGIVDESGQPYVVPVAYARDGMAVGIGAGQQSRVDCVKLAGRKVSTWYLRQHPKVQALPFKADIKRQAKVNARVRYIEGGFAVDFRTLHGTDIG